MFLNLCQLKPHNIPDILHDLNDKELANLAEHINSCHWKNNYGRLEMERFVLPELIRRLKKHSLANEFSNV